MRSVYCGGLLYFKSITNHFKEFIYTYTKEVVINYIDDENIKNYHNVGEHVDDVE